MNAMLFTIDPKTRQKSQLDTETVTGPQLIEITADISGPTPMTLPKPGECANPFPGSFTINAFTGPGSTADFRHDHHIVCSYLDGHVASTTLEELKKRKLSKYSIPFGLTVTTGQ